jgi:hypothetical protein
MCQHFYTLPLYAWNRRIFPEPELISFLGVHATPGMTIFSPEEGVKATRREGMAEKADSEITNRLAVVVLTVVWLAKWIATTTTTTMMMIRTMEGKS